MEYIEQFDHWLESMVHAGSAPLWFTLLIAVVLGLRHATDPDHLAAISTLVAKDGVTSSDAMRVGRAWGYGHGATMMLFGLPVVLFAVDFPEALYKIAEGLVGVIIIYYSIRLAGQYMSGAFHFHGTRRPHQHGTVATTTTARKSFGVGVVHGVGGSYGGALLVLATFSTAAGAAFGLTLFTAASVLSMMLVTWVFAKMVTNHRYMHVVNFAIPIFCFITFLFGIVYLHGALS